MAEQVVAEFATGLLRTRVLDRGDQVDPDARYAWERAAGALRGTPLGRPAPVARRAAGHVVGGWHLALPAEDLPAEDLPAEDLPAEDRADGDPAVLRFLVGGRATAAAALCTVEPALLAGEDPEAGTPALVAALRSTGALLRRLHAEPPPPDGSPVRPSGPARLVGWLRRGAGPGAAAPAHALVRERLGDDRLGLVHDWVGQLLQPERPVLVHGGATLGSVVLPGPGARPALLTGEDLGAGAPALDVGSLVGDLVELRAALQRTCPPGLLTPMVTRVDASLAALLAGYADGPGAGPGTGPDAVDVGRAAAVRVLTHLQDFAAYVGWSPDLSALADVVRDLVDAPHLVLPPELWSRRANARVF